MEQNSEKVVLVHGVASHRCVMWPIAYRLWRDGFRPETWPYITFFRPIESHAERFAAYLSTNLANEPKVHIVAHSMGSIVVRAALRRIEPSRIGRIVLLAPPNAGSPVARIISKLSGQRIAPARELSDQRESYVNKIKSTNDFQIGVLAARYDFLVPLSKTHFANETCHQTLAETHNSLLVSRKAARLMIHFLRNGVFES
ncbi:MAG: lipase family alpha/beta hydrolase [Pirellula sp.]|jgi:triacylglycerol esterase/lipase EstA (alpha/beta hydrolase family)|nr:alpha/beta hydrolase [Pirellula sp.]